MHEYLSSKVKSYRLLSPEKTDVLVNFVMPVINVSLRGVMIILGVLVGRAGF